MKYPIILDPNNPGRHHHSVKDLICGVIGTGTHARKMVRRLLEAGAIVIILHQDLKKAREFQRSTDSHGCCKITSSLNKKFDVVINCIVPQNPRHGQSPLHSRSFRNIQIVADVNYCQQELTNFLALGKADDCAVFILLPEVL